LKPAPTSLLICALPCEKGTPADVRIGQLDKLTVSITSPLSPRKLTIRVEMSAGRRRATFGLLRRAWSVV